MPDPSHDAAPHLAEQRPLILLRSALIGAASAIPVPGLSDMLTTALRRGLLLHVATKRHVDLDDEAVEVLLAETPKQQKLGAFSVFGSLISLLRKRGVMRRLFFGLAFLRAIEEALRIAHRATLLDHYCAQHHVGLAVHAEQARKLRKVMDEAIGGARKELLAESLDRLLTEGKQVAESAPQWVSQHLTHLPHLADVPPAVRTAAQHTHAFLRDLALRRYLGRLVQSFDQKWHAAAAAPAPAPADAK